MLLYVFVGNAIVVFDVLFVIVVIVVAGVVFCFWLFYMNCKRRTRLLDMNNLGSYLQNYKFWFEILKIM